MARTYDFTYNASMSPSANASELHQYLSGKFATEDHLYLRLKCYNDMAPIQYGITRENYNQVTDPHLGDNYLALAMWCIQDEGLGRYIHIRLSQEVKRRIEESAGIISKEDGTQFTLVVGDHVRIEPGAPDVVIASRIRRTEKQVRQSVVEGILRSMSLKTESIQSYIGEYGVLGGWWWTWQPTMTVDNYPLYWVQQWMRENADYGAPRLASQHEIDAAVIVEFRELDKYFDAIKSPLAMTLAENLEFHTKTVERVKTQLRQIGFTLYKQIKRLK